MPVNGTTALAKPAQPVNQELGKSRLAVFPGATKDDEPQMALVKVTPGGLVRSMLTRVHLSRERNETYEFGAYDPVTRSWVKRNVITAGGYDAVNRFGGVAFLSPDTVADDDGNPRSNPWIDRQDGSVKRVRVRRIGIGRNPAGNIVARDYTLTYDLELYFAQDVWARWSGKKKDTTTQAWGALYDTANIPPTARQDAKKKIVRCPGGVSLALDLASKEVVNLFHEHLNRQKFAERNAITICERNILKKHFGVTTVGADGTVAVVAWMQPDREMAEFGKIAALAAKGKVELGNGEEMQVIQDAEVIETKEEIDAALAGDVEEEQQPADAIDDDAPVPGVEPIGALLPGTGGQHALSDARALLRTLCDQIVDKEKIHPLLKQWGIDSIADATDVHALRNAAKAIDLLRLTEENTRKQSLIGNIEDLLGDLDEGARKAAYKTAGLEWGCKIEEQTPDAVSKLHVELRFQAANKKVAPASEKTKPAAKKPAPPTKRTEPDADQRTLADDVQRNDPPDAA